jgi:hypothetical protein
MSWGMGALQGNRHFLSAFQLLPILFYWFGMFFTFGTKEQNKEVHQISAFYSQYLIENEN